MVQIGKFNHLQVVSTSDFGLFLDAEHLDTILLPNNQVPEGAAVGDWLDVFIYFDSEDRLIATRKRPFAQEGQCAALKVKDVNRYGAFMDWGLPKDLLVPLNQQRKPMEVGQTHVVYLYLDEYTQRITGSAKISNFLNEETAEYSPNDPVELLIIGRTDIGYKAVIEQRFLGVIFNEDVIKPLRPGDKITGYIKQIREDRKIDLAMQLQGTEARLDIGQRIMSLLEKNGGVMMLSDKSSPDEIFAAFQVSKGNFKKALGGLYKQKKVVIEKDRVLLATK